MFPSSSKNEANLAAIFYRDYHVYNKEVDYKDFVALMSIMGLGLVSSVKVMFSEGLMV